MNATRRRVRDALADVENTLGPLIAAAAVRLCYDALWSRRAADEARTLLGSALPIPEGARVLWAVIAHHDATRAAWPRTAPPWWTSDPDHAGRPWPSEEGEAFEGSGRVLAITRTARAIAADPPKVTPIGDDGPAVLAHTRRLLFELGALPRAVAPDPGLWERLDLTAAARITQHAETYTATLLAAGMLAAEADALPPAQPVYLARTA